MHLFSITPANIVIYHTLLKTTDSLDYNSVAGSMGLAATSVTYRVVSFQM